MRLAASEKNTRAVPPKWWLSTSSRRCWFPRELLVQSPAWLKVGDVGRIREGGGCRQLASGTLTGGGDWVLATSQDVKRCGREARTC